MLIGTDSSLRKCLPSEGSQFLASLPGLILQLPPSHCLPHSCRVPVHSMG